MTNSLDAESESHNWDMEQSITLGLAAASSAGILAAYAGPNYDGYVAAALVCFIIVLPLVLTVYTIAHPAFKPLNLAVYGAPVAAVTVIASLALTLVGFGLLVMHLSAGLGAFFIAWCVAAPLLVVGGCVAVGKMLGTAVPPEPGPRKR